MAEQEIPWRDLVAVLHRRRKLILQVFAGGALTVLTGVWFQAPSYKATATLMVTSDRARVAVSPDPDTPAIIDRVTDEDLTSEATLLRSEALIREALELHEHEPIEEQRRGPLSRIASLILLPLRLPGMLYRTMHDIPWPTSRDWQVQGVAKHLSVSPVSKSNLIQVSYEAANPQWAASFVNELVARHIERHAKLNQQSEARRFYESQRQLLGEKFRTAEDALQAFYAREGPESTPEHAERLRTRLGEIEAILASSQTELAEGTARIAFLTHELQSHPKSIATGSQPVQNPSEQVVKSRVLELELQRSELLAKYALTSVKVQDLDRQILDAKRLLNVAKENGADSASAANPTYQALEVDLSQTRAQMAAVQARGQDLKSQIDDIRVKMAHVDEKAAEQERLQQEVSAAKDAYVNYSKKVEEARFTSALDESSIVNIAIAERATVPVAPEKSKKAVVVALGAVMSLMAGIGLAFVRDRLDPAVKNAADARSATGLPVLAEVSR
jgi:uncharacterized protein involved in exopolysaccharide biosynthesis